MRSTDRRLAALACLLVVLLCGAHGCSSGSSPGPRYPVTGETTDARLGPGDTFEVKVYGEESLSSKFQVGEDGSINYPLIGTVQAAGRSSAELARDIQKALADKQILRNPSVSVMVVEQASKRVTVVGAVTTPGTFQLTPGLTVVQVISLAGGMSALAKDDDVVVTRKTDGKLVRYTVAVGKVSEGRADDMLLQPGDIVFVPERIF